RRLWQQGIRAYVSGRHSRELLSRRRTLRRDYPLGHQFCLTPPIVLVRAACAGAETGRRAGYELPGLRSLDPPNFSASDDPLERDVQSLKPISRRTDAEARPHAAPPRTGMANRRGSPYLSRPWGASACSVSVRCHRRPRRFISSDHRPQVMPQLETASMKPGGWPDASLPEHVLLGKFDRSVSLGAWAYNEELLVESFLTRAINLLDRAVHDWEIVFVDDG